MGVLRMLGTLTAAAVAFSGYAAWRRQQRSTLRRDVPRLTAEPLQRWEDEGGAVPMAQRSSDASLGRTDDLLEPDGAEGTSADGTPSVDLSR